MEAAKRGEIKKVREILDEGVDVNSRDRHGFTALHWASECGHIGIVEELIARGAEIDARGPYAQTPLSVVVRFAVVSRRKDLREIAEILIKKGADVNAINGDFRSPLHTAAASGDKEMVVLLIRNGADVNANDGQHTPLDLAVAQGHKDIVTLLRQHGGKSGKELK